MRLNSQNLGSDLLDAWSRFRFARQVGLLDRLLNRPIRSLGNGMVEANCYDLLGGFEVQVAGESHYQQQLEIAAGGRKHQGVDVRVRAVLRPEPDNPYDPNAIAVIVERGGVVGYLTRRDALQYRPVIEELARRKLLGSCMATIRGGWDRGGGDRGHFGIFLDLAPPAMCIAEDD